MYPGEIIDFEIQSQNRPAILLTDIRPVKSAFEFGVKTR